MDWVALIELLLPALLELLENCTDDNAVNAMRNPGIFHKFALRRALAKVLNSTESEIWKQLAEASEEDLRVLCAAAKAAKAAKG